VRLHEKGGKRHEMPTHHNLEAYLDAYYWLRVLPFLAREEQRAEQGFDVSQCQ
jgi:hypothetical protein